MRLHLQPVTAICSQAVEKRSAQSHGAMCVHEFALELIKHAANTAPRATGDASPASQLTYERRCRGVALQVGVVHLRDGGDAPPTPDGAHRAHARRPELPGITRPAHSRVCAAARPQAAHHDRAGMVGFKAGQAVPADMSSRLSAQLLADAKPIPSSMVGGQSSTADMFFEFSDKL